MSGFLKLWSARLTKELGDIPKDSWRTKSPQMLTYVFAVLVSLALEIAYFDQGELDGGCWIAWEVGWGMGRGCSGRTFLGGFSWWRLFSFAVAPSMQSIVWEGHHVKFEFSFLAI